MAGSAIRRAEMLTGMVLSSFEHPGTRLQLGCCHSRHRGCIDLIKDKINPALKDTFDNIAPKNRSKLLSLVVELLCHDNDMPLFERLRTMELANAAPDRALNVGAELVAALEPLHVVPPMVYSELCHFLDGVRHGLWFIHFDDWLFFEVKYRLLFGAQLLRRA